MSGQAVVYLEALDRDVRKQHKQPSIGVLLCASKEDEIVEYALNRTFSPALIAKYQTQLPDKHALRRSCTSFIYRCRTRRKHDSKATEHYFRMADYAEAGRIGAG